MTAPSRYSTTATRVRYTSQASGFLRTLTWPKNWFKTPLPTSGEGQGRSWLYRITRNRATDLDRRRRVRPLSAGEEPLRNVSGDPNPEASVALWDMARALSCISEEHREVLTLAYFEGLSQREISRRTGIPLGTVKSRTTAALKRLRRTMEDDTAAEAWHE